MTNKLKFWQRLSAGSKVLAHRAYAAYETRTGLIRDGKSWFVRFYEALGTELSPDLRKSSARVAQGLQKSVRFAATILVLLWIGVGNVWGEDVTFTAGTDVNSSKTITKSSVTLTLSSACPNLNGYSEYRIYSGASFTISCSAGITKIVITTNSDKGNATKLSATSGYSATGTTGTWTGDATSVQINADQGSQVRVTKIVVTTKSASYTITATRNNDSYGTVSVTGTTITATPYSGYRVKSGTDGYTVTSGTATVVNNGDNTFTVTPSSNCTVQINFESKGCTDHGASSIIGGALSDADHGPLHAYYDYSTSQILYTKSDLDLAAGKKGTIKSIYFEYSGAAAMAARTIKIYMANTDLSSLTTSNYVPYASFTQVYSGTFSCGSAGWYEITLDTPFDYNGAGQLAVMIDDNTNTYESSKSFKYHSATGKQIYKRQDDTDIDPSSWTPASAIDYRPNTKFCIQEADMVQYTVNWYVNGSLAHSQTGYPGTTLTSIPTPDESDCDGEKVFVGWYTSTYSHATDAPDFVSPTTIPNGGANYYAVFATASAGDPVNEWRQCTSLSDFVDGDFYLFVSPSYNSTYYYVPAVSSTTAANNFSKAGEAVASNSTPTSVTKAQGAWKLIKSGTAWKIQSSNSSTTYLYATNDNNGLAANTATYASSTWSIAKHSTTSTFAFQYNLSRYLCAYNASPYGFRTYTGTSTNGTAYLTVYHWDSYTPTTYSNYETNCCTQLGSIKGSFSRTGG